jgi:hypothetical protein
MQKLKKQETINIPAKKAGTINNSPLGHGGKCRNFKNKILSIFLQKKQAL